MEQACFFERHVVPAMEHLRRPVDQLEMIVDKNIWPMHLMETFCLRYSTDLLL